MRVDGIEPSPAGWKPAMLPPTPNAQEGYLGRSLTARPIPAQHEVEMSRIELACTFLQGRTAPQRTSPHGASESNAVPRIWNPIGRHDLHRVALRTRIELVSLDRQSSCDASRITQLEISGPGARTSAAPAGWPGVPGASRTHASGFRRAAAGSAGEDENRQEAVTEPRPVVGLTRGIEPPHVGHDHAASPDAQRQRTSNGPSKSNRTTLSRASTGRFHQGSFRGLSRELGAVEPSIGTACGDRTRLTRVKTSGPHQKSKAA